MLHAYALCIAPLNQAMKNARTCISILNSTLLKRVIFWDNSGVQAFMVLFGKTRKYKQQIIETCNEDVLGSLYPQQLF